MRSACKQRSTGWGRLSTSLTLVDSEPGKREDTEWTPYTAGHRKKKRVHIPEGGRKSVWANQKGERFWSGNCKITMSSVFANRTRHVTISCGVLCTGFVEFQKFVWSFRHIETAVWTLLCSNFVLPEWAVLSTKKNNNKHLSAFAKLNKRSEKSDIKYADHFALTMNCAAKMKGISASILKFCWFCHTRQGKQVDFSTMRNHHQWQHHVHLARNWTVGIALLQRATIRVDSLQRDVCAPAEVKSLQKFCRTSGILPQNQAALVRSLPWLACWQICILIRRQSAACQRGHPNNEPTFGECKNGCRITFPQKFTPKLKHKVNRFRMGLQHTHCWPTKRQEKRARPIKWKKQNCWSLLYLWNTNSEIKFSVSLLIVSGSKISTGLTWVSLISSWSLVTLSSNKSYRISPVAGSTDWKMNFPSTYTSQKGCIYGSMLLCLLRTTKAIVCALHLPCSGSGSYTQVRCAVTKLTAVVSSVSAERRMSAQFNKNKNIVRNRRVPTRHQNWHKLCSLVSFDLNTVLWTHSRVVSREHFFKQSPSLEKIWEREFSHLKAQI